MLVIGDVHGKFEEYHELIKNRDRSIQVGDMGIDYSGLRTSGSNHYFIQGNHDNYKINHPQCLNNFGMLDGIFYIRGAYSIDRWRKIEGETWFADEELTNNEMTEAVSLFERQKPEIVISHDCPQCIASNFGVYDKTMTRNGLQTMFQIHQPRLWLFGHHHRSMVDEFWGTEFRCLAELETYEVPIQFSPQFTRNCQ